MCRNTCVQRNARCNINETELEEKAWIHPIKQSPHSGDHQPHLGGQFDVLLVGSLLLCWQVSLWPSTPSSNKDAVVVRLSKTFLTQLIQKKADFSNVPGTVSNVQVSQIQQNSITITADDQVGMLGVTTTKHFTLILQPVVSNCAVHMRVLHADLQGVPVTNVAATFENQIDQQMGQTNASLPKGFVYCATGISTESQAIIVSYSATPT
jgi:hypothetical protein